VEASEVALISCELIRQVWPWVLLTPHRIVTTGEHGLMLEERFHNRLLEAAASAEPDLVAFIRDLVECESPTDSPADVNRLLDLLIERTHGWAAATRWSAPGFGDHLLLEFKLDSSNAKRTLALGHSDTVWPAGALASMPFRQADGRLWGPGVLDMKTGIALLIFAARTVIDLALPVRRGLALLVVSDEEVGSPSSRFITEREALESSHVLVLEPGSGLTGKLKTARKSVGHYVVKVTGRAAHSGVDFEAGASAIVEASHVIQRCAALTDIAAGTTVNPGVIHGGSRSNVIAAEVSIEVDVRAVSKSEGDRIDAAIRTLRPVDPRCSIQVDGGINRPPMERSPAIAALFAQAQQYAAALGFQIEESSTGGGSDGNFTAALGVPTLDGLGAVGEGAHAAQESVVVRYLPHRLALLAALVAGL
jgi:glutamate carboxypeptidase